MKYSILQATDLILNLFFFGRKVIIVDTSRENATVAIVRQIITEDTL